MRKNFVLIMVCMVMTFTNSCKNGTYSKNNNQNKLTMEASTKKTEPVLGLGTPVTANFTGEAWLQYLSGQPEYECNVYNVTFAPGTRNYWHSHTIGQILLCTEGIGYYQEKGKPARSLQPGDVVNIPANTIHWHGAAPDSRFTHIGITPRVSENNTEWMGEVTDEEYSEAISTFAQETPKNEKDTDRIELCKKNYTTLFGGEALTGQGSDPEMMDILQKFIFGDIFRTGNLDMKTREMITCITLTAMQTLPQLKAHAGAALNAGVTPVELRELVYLCAPFIGFPKTLNALGTINEVFKERGIALPLESQETVKEEERFEKGKEIQRALYGEKMKEALKTLPAGMNDTLPRLLTEMCFGDFYTRSGLDIKTRELLSLCILATLGAERQIESHAQGNLKAGNNKETLIAAMIQCLPYIGFPLALNAIHIIKDIE